jgi:hypothetical protein
VFGRPIVRNAAALLLLQATACSDESKSPPPDVPFLSTDAYFSVGGHRISVPMAVLRGPGQVFTLNREKPAKSRKEMVEAQPGLLAVWTVWSRDGETADQRAERQGLAIVEFVRRGIGPIEDKTLATAD